MTRRVGWGRITERGAKGCKPLITEPSEDYLRVAAKQSGDSVTIMKEVVLANMPVQAGWNRET
ncbi:hypothetical protein LI154_12590 [[Clostridium] scindens]|uniref:hypothetical protein n=1 Tax=Clostridium scindens (strain JCM 10418 / VPI 12708) TaxID=29347 RepID=UPI0001655888|nr:hypothetical protein [[Clostridium] scindens]EDS07773.1 hypothetical protein CLOSCI_01249 [[Clostridium] scindens ATCC 35704]MCB6646070.1 hypothetical protein [[Clostridium] scindens]